MPQINTSYAEMARGFAGQLSDIRENTIESFVQGEASAAIPFGVAVAQGAAGAPASGIPDSCINMVDTNSVVVGVHVHSHAFNRDTQLDATGVLPDNVISILRKGQILMVHEGAVTKGAPCFVRFDPGAGGSVLGAVRADADTATAVSTAALTFAETKASVGDGLVLVNVNLP